MMVITQVLNNIFCTILCRSSGKKCEMLPVGEKNFFKIAFLWLAPPPSARRATSKTGLRSVRKYREQGGNRGVCYIDYSGSRTSEHEVVGSEPPGSAVPPNKPQCRVRLQRVRKRGCCDCKSHSQQPPKRACRK